MKYYFFHHPLESVAGVPGRYAFHCNGRLVAPDGTTNIGDFIAPIDGIGPDREGPNIDPCPFASPFPLVHSFCKLDALGGKYYVNNASGTSSGKVLSEVAAEGDVIYYGHLRVRKGVPFALFIDTVLVVARICTLPTRPDINNPRKHFEFLRGEPLASSLGAWAASPPTTRWQQLLSSDLWRFNLHDLDNGGNHSHTAHALHKILVGQVAPEGEEISALARRSTSYVPLADVAAGARPLPVAFSAEDSDPAFWTGLTTWLKDNSRMSNGNKPPTEVTSDLGTELYDKTRQRSGRNTDLAGSIAIPPLLWTRSSHVDKS